MKLNNLLSEFKKYKDEDTVLIYTMGKVGSSTIENSLKILDIPSIHTHFFGVKLNYRTLKLNKIDKLRLYCSEKMKMLAIKSAKKKKIITLVRDPVARNISWMFQALHDSLEHYISHNPRANVSMAELTEMLFRKYVVHDIAVDWFDIEFKKCTGVNVYDYEFDRKKGVTRIQAKNLDILVLKLSELNNLSEEISEFLGCNFKIVNDNDSKTKWYSDIYANFMSDFNVGDAYIDEMYKSNFFAHFFSNEDKSKLLKKWKSKSS